MRRPAQPKKPPEVLPPRRPRRRRHFTFPQPFPPICSSADFPSFQILAALTRLTEREESKREDRSIIFYSRTQCLECSFGMRRIEDDSRGILDSKERHVSSSQGVLVKVELRAWSPDLPLLISVV